MSFKFPIGVATIYNPVVISVITFLIIFIASCTPVNLSKQSEESSKEIKKIEQTQENSDENNIEEDTINTLKNKSDNIKDSPIKKHVTVLFLNDSNLNFTKQFINILELGIYNKNLKNVVFEIKFFNNENELKNVILKNKQKGNIFIGPIDSHYSKIANSLCDKKIIFFSFSSDTSLANKCMYLINFFPKNELEQLFISLENESKIALLYPENEYGYMINLLIDDVLNKSDAVLVNRSSYKNDLSNVRDAIKELGKYDLRKYELNRQKQILSSKTDKNSKKRLKKLEKFKTTSDYDFTHIIIADYGLNLLQVAPLLPYYDIDPNVVQFLGTGVIDDENFFLEPSLQGAIFPGIEKRKRMVLIEQYREIYDEKLLRISTLPYDLVGLLNYVFSRNMSVSEVFDLLDSSLVKFDGIDGEFYFKENMIERNLDILKIRNGLANKIN